MSKRQKKLTIFFKGFKLKKILRSVYDNFNKKLENFQGKCGEMLPTIIE